MEPNGQENTNTPSSYPQSGAPEPAPSRRKWPLSRTWTIILIVVILIGGVGFVLSRMMGGSSGSSQDSATLYIKRSGYEKVTDGIGDPLGLVSKTTNNVVTYRGTAVIQPCTLVSLKDVREAGLLTQPNQIVGSVTRVYFDGQGTGILDEAGDISLPFDSDSNNCKYSLVEGGLIDVTVYQPTYANSKAFDYAIGRNFTAIADTNGLKTFERKATNSKPNRSTYALRGNGFDAQFTIDTPNSEAKTKLLNLLASRLTAASTTPTPLEKFTFESPILEGDVANACDLITAADFKEVLEVEAGPFVEELVGSAVGVVRSATSDKLYNYVSHDCKRRSADHSTEDKTFLIDTKTYETAEGAIDALAFEQSANSISKTEKVSTVVGDETFFGNTASMDNALVFRKGRVIARISYFVPKGNEDIEASERIQRLLPIAQKIVNERLKGF